MKGYIWGRSVEPLLDSLSIQQSTPTPTPTPPQIKTKIDTEASTPQRGFDLIILSDLIFNHSQVSTLTISSVIPLQPTPNNNNSQLTAMVCLLARCAAKNMRRDIITLLPTTPK